MITATIAIMDGSMSTYCISFPTGSSFHDAQLPPEPRPPAVIQRMQCFQALPQVDDFAVQPLGPLRSLGQFLLDADSLALDVHPPFVAFRQQAICLCIRCLVM